MPIPILSTLTNNRFVAVGLGTFVTLVIQSSSATTVMLVSFVQAKLMTFAQSLGIILGATIGGFVAACIALMASALIIINVNDWRQYQNYLVNKQEAEKVMQEMTNPLFVSPETPFENPMFGKSN